MSLVMNLPSLEDEFKRLKIKEDSSSSLKCDRRFVLRNTKRIISQIFWIEHKKLHLVLDLDHTLVHTRLVSKLFESEKYLLKEADSRNDLWRYDDVSDGEYLIKIRPFVHQFLKESSEVFCMYVYTKAGHKYARKVLELIDPDKVYFGDRVITRRESPGSKNLDLVLADKRGIVIVDDRRSVWPRHKRNLLQITKYRYFRSKEDSEPKGSEDLEWEKQRDESEEKGPLANVLICLKALHKEFFSEEFEEKLDLRDIRLWLELLLEIIGKRKGFGLKV